MSEAQDALRRIEDLFSVHGSSAYEGDRRESVTALAHALQCAQLAEWAGAKPEFVIAALLHDIGHFSDGLAASDHHDDAHELRALPWLKRVFGPAVTEPIRLHVAAKRYLVAAEPGYFDGLSPASRHSLLLQGGPMNSDECDAFEAEPYASAAVLLRRWDDAAKEPGKKTPPLAYYLAMMAEMFDEAEQDRIAISAFSA